MQDDLQRATFDYFAQPAAPHDGMVADTSRAGLACLHLSTRIRARDLPSGSGAPLDNPRVGLIRRNREPAELVCIPYSNPSL